jgi:epoxide hydrolase
VIRRFSAPKRRSCRIFIDPVPVTTCIFRSRVSSPARGHQDRNNVIHRFVHWTEFDRGGHFAAMEQPDLLVGDVRAFFRPFRG